MHCTSPRTVGFKSDGKTISWSPRERSKEYAHFQLPCGQCLACRLDYSRQWAIRCVHEAQVHEKSSFITLTYSDENLTSPKLDYTHFQKFMKRLRKTQNDPIGVFVTGEYGDRTKRPHWHALLFNYRPKDEKFFRQNDLGDKVYVSETLKKLWGLGLVEYGNITFNSAGYCARYAAKKLVHGRDDAHEWHPISKKSSKHAIGKKWLEKFWPDVFKQGHVVLADGSTTSIPRYYEKWFKENHPDEWLRYIRDVKPKKIISASERSQLEFRNYIENVWDRGPFRSRPLSPNERKKIVLESKFKQLQDYLKL